MEEEMKGQALDESLALIAARPWSLPLRLVSLSRGLRDDRQKQVRRVPLTPIDFMERRLARTDVVRNILHIIRTVYTGWNIHGRDVHTYPVIPLEYVRSRGYLYVIPVDLTRLY